MHRLSSIVVLFRVCRPGWSLGERECPTHQIDPMAVSPVSAECPANCVSLSASALKRVESFVKSF